MNKNALASLILLSMTLVACGRAEKVAVRAEPPPDDVLPTGEQGGVVKVGQPYKVADSWYYPKEEPAYDLIGMASWYGPQFHGRATANGETFNMNALTAAHRTLPMPSFVKVTNLDNGRSMVLRVNDRGPFVDDRLIDVSRRAAQLLGFADKGLTRVRVQASNERGQVKSTLTLAQAMTKSGFKSAGPADPPSVSQEAPLEQFVVQLGAYSSRKNAQAQQEKATAAGINVRVSEELRGDRKLWLVRLGPFDVREKAERWLDQVVKQGFYGARVLNGAS